MFTPLTPKIIKTCVLRLCNSYPQKKYVAIVPNPIIAVMLSILH